MQELLSSQGSNHNQAKPGIDFRGIIVVRSIAATIGLVFSFEFFSHRMLQFLSSPVPFSSSFVSGDLENFDQQEQ